MHLADAFIQSDLHCIQVTVLHLSALYINFIYPTEDTVTNKGNKLNYYCNHLSSILVHFNNLYSYDFTYGLKKSCLLF